MSQKFWKISDGGPVEVSKTKLKEEKLLEENLEDWITNDPKILGEPLLLIGRQVRIPDINDKLDLLALDPQGNAVIIELKRGRLKDPVDMQALRYASYISKWGFEDFDDQARQFFGEFGNPDFNFNEKYETFCSDVGIDNIPDINSDQRIILVGAEIKDKLGSVALWLFEHNIDVKVIEVDLFKEGDVIFLQPQVIIPLPVSKFDEVGKRSGGDTSRPWIVNGKRWHLENRCKPTTKEMLLKLNDIVPDNFDVEGPRWNQKDYVAYRIGNYNWLSIETHANLLKLRFLVKAGSFDQNEIAEKLGIEEFDREAPGSEKLSLPSSVIVLTKTEDKDKIVLRVKDDFDLESEEFMNLLEEAYRAFPK
ncbi:MAG: hypothetical protein ACP5D6_11680 [Kosmotogaceae bacterium]